MEQSVDYIGFPLTEETRQGALSRYIDIYVRGEDHYEIYDPNTQFRRDATTETLEKMVKAAIENSDFWWGKPS